MRRILPKEQDQLLKELKYLENRLSSPNRPEKDYVLFGLGLIATLAFLFLGVNDYYTNSGQYLLGIFALWVLLFFSIFMCAQGVLWATITAILISLALNLALSYAIYTTSLSVQSLSVMADLFVLILITTSFRDKGYVLSTILLVGKNLYFTFLPGVELNYFAVLVDTIIILITGTFLLMVLYLFQLADRARMQMIRAEILALQNQDLISSWQGFFKK